MNTGGSCWPETVAEARALQEALRSRLVVGGAPDLDSVGLVAGADVSFSRVANRVYAAVVVLTYPGLAEVDVATAEGDATFPYVPGFLVYREGPVLERAFAALSRMPDVVLFDGHGLAHPRRLGIASHFGILLDRPTVGVAKSRLVGEFEDPGPEPGDTAPLIDRGEPVGCVLRTKRGVRPVFVSVGHRIGLEQAVDLALSCCRGYRLPEPTRLAHLRSNACRKSNGG
ncbi:MAG: deoxyribonuclease V [Thermoanaerobacterales bacterium]|nr:deoxyribonuclease V [Bacillota bacterium]MDI6907233.1 deoxyribonuclease V [Thermoanaerobacterales bacterium]